MSWLSMSICYCKLSSGLGQMQGLQQGKPNCIQTPQMLISRFAAFTPRRYPPIIALPNNRVYLINMAKPFDFPLEPYSIQVDFMRSLYSTLSSKKFGIFESPTGTGKTLSLICASFSWLLDNYTSSADTQFVGSQSWVNELAAPLCPEPAKSQKLSAGDTLYSKRSAQHLICYEQDPTAEPPLPVCSHPRILYVSRTHTQLDQFTNQIKQTKWTSLKVVRLGSRTQLCVNPYVKSMKSSLINYRCKELVDPSHKQESCAFYNGQDKVRSHLLQHISDIQELVQAGNRLRGCPYFASSRAVQLADVVVAPYSSVLNRRQRQASGIALDNTVVIIDEAHNLIEALCESYQAQVSHSHLKSCQAGLQLYYEKYAKLIGHRTGMHMRALMNLVNSLSVFLGAHQGAPFAANVAAFLVDNELHRVDFNGLANFMVTADCVRKIGGAAKAALENFDASCLHHFLHFVESLAQDTSSGKLLVEEGRLRYLLLDPTKPFRQMLAESRCLILAGGTMEPKEEFTALVEHLAASQVELFQCGHVISEDKLLLGTLRGGASGGLFRFTYGNRDSQQQTEQLIGLCESLAGVVPNGVVVFLPSYQFLSALKASMQRAGAVERIERSKKVLFDEKQERVLEGYSKFANERGAMLFAVVRGKLSEGINFSNRLGRCVVVVGMPYANRNDLEVSERMSYLDAKQGSFTGQMFYENGCHKAVNQSIGRAIRHKEDYAVVVLVDARHEQFLGKRPGWMQKYAKKYLTPPALIEDVRRFFDSKR